MTIPKRVWSTYGKYADQEGEILSVRVQIKGAPTASVYTPDHVSFDAPTPDPPPPPVSVYPVGVPGAWWLAFEDQFAGTELDTSKWAPLVGYRWGAVTIEPGLKNLAVKDGNLLLTLASATSGAAVGSNGYALAVGDYTEARVYFPGDGVRIYNWPAWWTSGPNWPADGEHDIAEGLGTLTVNYHSSSGAHNKGTVLGVWANAFHVYGLHRKPGGADVYWDGKLVRSYGTDDNGKPQRLILYVVSGNTPAYGEAGQVRVDYVRAWRPA